MLLSELFDDLEAEAEAEASLLELFEEDVVELVELELEEEVDTSLLDDFEEDELF